MKNNFFKYILLITILAVADQKSHAQLNSFGAGYFQNQYLFNPAMSGLVVKHGSIGAGFRKQGDVDGAPVSMFLTGDYRFGGNMGVGVNVFYDKAGIQNTAKVMATYNYHVQVGTEEQLLHFGLSVGGVQARLDNTKIVGNPDDPALYNFNDRYMKFESDFGIAYTSPGLNVQAAFPNLVSYFSKDTKNVANRATFFTAVSYKLDVSGDKSVIIEPKAVFRGIQGNSNLIDAGANVSALHERINVFGLYHSSKSFSVGAGLKISDFVNLGISYTTAPSSLRPYSGGDMEAALKFTL